MSERFELGEKSIVAMHKKRTLSFKIFNRIMNGLLIFLYKIYLLPLFGIGNKIILVHTIGRKTGKKRTTPTLIFTFYTGKFTLYVARGLKAHWLKNILATEDKIFKIQKGFRKWRVKATLVEDKVEKFKHLKFYFEELPEAKNIFGYDKKKHGDVFDTEEFTKILDIVEFVQLIPVIDL
ncbi:MAG: nitroreductase family deazaflavin-dependent oxidoreductase [Candidatus Heimdallarchaeota archaeon]|nr:nitroreductase family deazaflavin-dependent oxidoreductase [Candidatus Heimdallarchaeota archaeon]